MIHLFAFPTLLQFEYGASLEKVVDLLTGAKFEPGDLIIGHDRLTRYTSLADFLSRHSMIEPCGRTGWVYREAPIQAGLTPER